LSCFSALRRLCILDDGLHGEALSDQLARLRGVAEGGQVDPDAAVRSFQLFGDCAGLGAGFAGWGLAALGCNVVFLGWELVEVEPETTVVCDVLLKFLQIGSAQDYFNSGFL
jgi:hypothetical protein